MMKVPVFDGDNEEFHCKWDALILDILRQVGYNTLADQYEKDKERFWYA